MSSMTNLFIMIVTSIFAILSGLVFRHFYKIDKFGMSTLIAFLAMWIFLGAVIQAFVFLVLGG